jgi:hypothetical protein
VYWPAAEILPGPATTSPPETDQTNGALTPLKNVAVNCSTGLPFESIALQPAQLVSIAFPPIGAELTFAWSTEIENDKFLEIPAGV